MNKIIRVLTFALLAAGLSAGSSEAKTAKLEIDAETKVVDSLSNALRVHMASLRKKLRAALGCDLIIPLPILFRKT